MEKYMRERIREGCEYVTLPDGLLVLPAKFQEIVQRTVSDDSEKIEDGRWQCDVGRWHNVGATCYCKIEMIETDDKTIRLEERKPGQLSAPTQEEQRVIPPARNRRDTFSYKHGAHIKTF